MQVFILNNKFFLILGLLTLFACDSRTGIQVRTPLSPGAAPTKGQGAAKETGLFYGNHFRVQNSSAYERLLESCRRCGLKRLINQGGRTTYQRFYDFSGSDPKRCKNLSANGYIQIHFHEEKLPTTATVSIQPKYTGTDQRVPKWNPVWTFSITARAEPINENKGFEIFLTPQQGLGGINTLVLRSEDSNPVSNYTLDLTARYGHRGEETIISGQILRLSARSVQKASFGCDTYTN